MVTIDDKGNKVNYLVEHRFDTITNESVEIEHSTILAEALRDALFEIFPNIDYIEIVY